MKHYGFCKVLSLPIRRYFYSMFSICCILILSSSFSIFFDLTSFAFFLFLSPLIFRLYSTPPTIFIAFASSHWKYSWSFSSDLHASTDHIPLLPFPGPSIFACFHRMSKLITCNTKDDDPSYLNCYQTLTLLVLEMVTIYWPRTLANDPFHSLLLKTKHLSLVSCFWISNLSTAYISTMAVHIVG